jgi:hypothetical protein
MPSLRRTIPILLTTLLLAGPVLAQSKSDKSSEKFAIFVVSGHDSSAVTKVLVQKMNDSKPFVVAAKDDASKAVVIVDCMHRDKSDTPFICMYVSHYNGAAFKTLLGAGEYMSKDAEDMANNLLSAIASDIVERWDETDKRNLRESLEACLFLTDSKCNVPTPLQAEFGEKQLTLGQYLILKNRQ